MTTKTMTLQVSYSRDLAWAQKNRLVRRLSDKKSLSTWASFSLSTYVKESKAKDFFFKICDRKTRPRKLGEWQWYFKNLNLICFWSRKKVFDHNVWLKLHLGAKWCSLHVPFDAVCICFLCLETQLLRNNFGKKS